MPDSPAIGPEREVQPPFRKTDLLQLLAFFGLVFAVGWWLGIQPDREELGRRVSSLRLEPVHLQSGGFQPFRLAGAWKVTGTDPRVGGVSGLAIHRGQFLALTDSGVIIRFGRPVAPTIPAIIDELPGGPGDRRFKSRRDSEALTPDPSGRGWWVAFENRHELWLYDREFRRPLERFALPRKAWRRNRGLEGVASGDNALLLFPEGGDNALELLGTTARIRQIAAPSPPVADAVRLPTGELLVLNRRLTPAGFANSIGWLERSSAGFRYALRAQLPLSPLDNVEAIAAEPTAAGGVRLWLMTDDNFQRPMRTLLVALELPPASAR